ncbi:hypothetical protein LUZ60_006588 [Juncus effusus]|nr:hypothetical protein LUZ60_006588 [Juncus effusus]
MEVEQGNNETAGFSQRWPCLGNFFQKIKSMMIEFLKKMKKIGKNDPRRIIHAIKVGLALTLVSTTCYVTPLFDGFGVSAIWAVLTVVVVMEYTVGLIRAFATLFAGLLVVGAHEISMLCGAKGEPILLAIFVFLLDLHNLITNLDKLASFLEGIEAECFGEKLNFESLEGKPFLQVHKSILDSKATEDEGV